MDPAIRQTDEIGQRRRRTRADQQGTAVDSGRLQGPVILASNGPTLSANKREKCLPERLVRSASRRRQALVIDQQRAYCWNGGSEKDCAGQWAVSVLGDPSIKSELRRGCSSATDRGTRSPPRPGRRACRRQRQSSGENARAALRWKGQCNATLVSAVLRVSPGIDI